jgi:hypothetical protein
MVEPKEAMIEARVSAFYALAQTGLAIRDPRGTTAGLARDIGDFCSSGAGSWPQSRTTPGV